MVRVKCGPLLIDVVTDSHKISSPRDRRKEIEIITSLSMAIAYKQ